MGIDHCLFGETGEAGDIGQVTAVVHRFDGDGAGIGKLGRGKVQLLQECCGSNGFPPPGEPDQDGSRCGQGIDLAGQGSGLQVRVEGDDVRQGSELHQQRTGSDGTDALYPTARRAPGCSPAHTKLVMVTPAFSSPARTSRAMATAPAVSPWTQMDSACIGITVPSTAVMVPSVASRTMLAVTVPAS